jgi:hypothetical protein
MAVEEFSRVDAVAEVKLLLFFKPRRIASRLFVEDIGEGDMRTTSARLLGCCTGAI